MTNEIYIPDGFEYVYSPLIKKMILKPKQGFSDNYLQDNQFVPQRNIITLDESEDNVSNTKTNNNLHKAKKVKNDEFYTSLESIVSEVRHYKEQFKGKIVYCPCDKAFNKGRSNFFEFFSTMFHELGLKELICTQYNPNNNGKMVIFNGHGVQWNYSGYMPDNVHIDESEIETIILKGDGSFSSQECQEIMSKCDIVVTNPPFSLLRDFIAQIMKYNKQFLIIGPQNAITYKEIYPLIKANKIWLGYSMVKEFEVPIDKIENKNQRYDNITGKFYQKFGNICWYTNMVHNKRKEFIPIYKKFNPELHLKYDNYDAINVDRVENIPVDYDGLVGVPISFLYVYNPEQFDIIKFRKGDDNKDLRVQGQDKYFRIIVKRK